MPYVRQKVIDMLFDELRAVKKELQNIEKQLSAIRQPRPVDLSDLNGLLLALPGHLQKTMLAVMKLGRVTASDVSHLTKRARAVESSYLNQLELLKRLRKERVGRKAVFWI